MKNEETRIERAIKSVLIQNKYDVEIIVVDDHSRDRSYNVLKKYIKDDKVSYYMSQGIGVSEARNTGLKYVTGDYILFLDADDSLCCNAFEILSKCIKKEKNDADIIFNGYLRLRENQTIIKKYKYKYACGEGKSIICDYLNKVSFTHLGALCFKRDFLKRNMLWFNKDLSYAEDLFFIIQALYYADNVICTYREIYRWTLRKGSTLYKKDLKKFTSLNAIISMKIFLQEKNMINNKIEIALSNQYAMLVLDSTKSLLWLGCSTKEVNEMIRRQVDFNFVKPIYKLSRKVKKDIILLYYFRLPFLTWIKTNYTPNNFCG